MTATTPKTVAELRAQMAEGCAQAARVWETAARSGITNANIAARIGASLRRDAKRNAALARKEATR